MWKKTDSPGTAFMLNHVNACLFQAMMHPRTNSLMPDSRPSVDRTSQGPSYETIGMQPMPTVECLSTGPEAPPSSCASSLEQPCRLMQHPSQCWCQNPPVTLTCPQHIQQELPPMMQEPLHHHQPWHQAMTPQWHPEQVMIPPSKQVQSHHRVLANQSHHLACQRHQQFHRTRRNCTLRQRRRPSNSEDPEWIDKKHSPSTSPPPAESDTDQTEKCLTAPGQQPAHTPGPRHQIPKKHSR